VATPGGLARALSELLGVDVELVRGKVGRAAPHPDWVKLGFESPGEGARWLVALEPALAASMLGLLLRRPLASVTPVATFDAPLLGALSALLLEVARNSGAELPMSTRAPEHAPEAVTIHATVLLHGKPYGAALSMSALGAAETVADPLELLGMLAAHEVALPLVVGTSLSTPRALATLERGGAFCPGEGLWVNASKQGTGVLVAGSSERGFSVDVGPNGRIVLREPTRVALAAAEETTMESDDSEPPTLAEAVLDAPLVVRVELGQVSLPARKWAALRPGDVIETGRALTEPVVLRAGGRELARGELVNLEGELGIRVLSLSSEGS
jgi:flagellar motor switch/type III secretory pathway protein FliN